jgi:hypothetical protein
VITDRDVNPDPFRVMAVEAYVPEGTPVEFGRISPAELSSFAVRRTGRYGVASQIFVVPLNRLRFELLVFAYFTTVPALNVTVPLKLTGPLT